MHVLLHCGNSLERVRIESISLAMAVSCVTSLESVNQRRMPSFSWLHGNPHARPQEPNDAVQGGVLNSSQGLFGVLPFSLESSGPAAACPPLSTTAARAAQ